MNTNVRTENPLISIVILNWNGWRDTLDCLESVYKLSYSNFIVVVVDNGSSDDSIKKIKGGLSDPSENNSSKAFLAFSNQIIDVDSETLSSIATASKLNTCKGDLYFIHSQHNLGFAKGNNLGIVFSLNVGTDYIWLLNNDTIVTEASLCKMVSFMQKTTDIGVLTPQIRHYYENKIWNCGGNLKWKGIGHKYIGANLTKVEGSWFYITFLTGCSLLAKSCIFQKYGMLSERFFFGEEDQEFSNRMSSNNVRIACLNDAVIYHKVGQTITGGNNNKHFNRTYIHYLNKLIYARSLLKQWEYPLFLCGTCLHIFFKLRREGLKLVAILKFLKLLLKDIINNTGVSKSLFESRYKIDWI